jgi:hypothetical protein
MATKSYVNAVREDEVSIAIQRLLIAPYPTTWTPARVDLTPGNLPAGFYDLGAVVEDSPTLQVSRQSYVLTTGIPAVRQYEKITQIDGTLSVQLHSYSWRKLQIALGNYSAVSSATLVTTILSVQDNKQFTVCAVGSLSTPVTVGDKIIVATAAKVNDIDAGETVILSVVTENASLTTYYCNALPQTPTTSNWGIYKYAYVEQFYGTATNREFTLLAVADFLEGDQVVHEFYKVRPAGDFERTIRPGENLRLPLQFNAFGVTKSVRGNNELVICREVQFPKTAGN